MSLKKNNQEPERRQVQVVIEEAAGKRIRQLVIQGPPDPDMNDFAVCVSFDDDTMISIELSLLLRFGIFYDRTVDGELQSVKEYPKTSAGIKTAVAICNGRKRKPEGRHGWVERGNRRFTLTDAAEFSSIAEPLGRQWIISGSRKQITRSLWSWHSLIALSGPSPSIPFR